MKFINKIKKTDINGKNFLGISLSNNIVNNTFAKSSSYVVAWQGYAVIVKVEKENINKKIEYSLA
ncbi:MULTISPECIES: hypothetical protein [Helcococcus]|uniref:Uncharacterized protein n=1 Tax=Helcococcus bovis TaxID=3153252 RepID=A0ABW9F7I4_9FIRM